jgi:hypothetical protein
VDLSASLETLAPSLDGAATDLDEIETLVRKSGDKDRDHIFDLAQSMYVSVSREMPALGDDEKLSWWEFKLRWAKMQNLDSKRRQDP